MVAGSLSLALAGCGQADQADQESPEGEEETTETAEDTQEMESEYTHDVVVVGGGGAGFSAAIMAAEEGSDVVLIEKLPFVGGNTLISGGEMNVPNNWVQENLGIEGDSIETYIEDTLEGGDYENSEEMVEVLAENALDAAEWLRDDINVDFYDDQLFQFGGHSYERALIPEGHTGQELISKFQARADELDIEIFTETEATQLIQDDSGKIVGVEADHDGDTITFNANNGVVLTTGGFGANVEMRVEANEEYDDRYGSTNVSGATGDGIVLAQEVGAAVDNMEYIQTYPVSNPETGDISLLADTRFDGAALINQEGDRFVEELERRDVISEAILDQTGGYAYQVWDTALSEYSRTYEMHESEFKRLEESGLIHLADTLEEAAEFFDIPVDNFLETVEEINEYAESGEDPDFNHRAGLAPIKEGPFFIQKATPSVHHTMGGLVVDVDTHVLDEDGEIIDGLYAAGELTGLTHGTNRLGGNAITDIIVFGRMAGLKASE